MGLVEYSDSDNEEQSEKPIKKRKLSSHDTAAQDAAPPPPLPAAFRDLYSSTVRLSNSDNPELHGGRKRIIPHVQGNWNAHVYLECTFISPSHLSELD